MAASDSICSIQANILCYQGEKTGLEDLPAFSTSLGCLDAPYVLDAENTVYTVPIGAQSDHYLNVRGGAVGSITVAPGFDDDDDANTAVSIEMTLRTNDRELLDSVLVEQHDPEQEANSFWRLNTPYPGELPPEGGREEGEAPSGAKACMRYDIVLRVPRALRKLHVAAHAVAHVRFAESPLANATVPPRPLLAPGELPADPLRMLDDLFVTFYSPREDNVLLASHDVVAADRISLEMAGGWMTGSVGVRNRTRVMTQRGDAKAVLGVVAMPFIPANATGPADNSSTRGTFRAVTGFESTDITFYNPYNRPMTAWYLSTGNGDLNLHYDKTDFNGQVNVTAKSFEVHDMQMDPLVMNNASRIGNAKAVTKWIGDVSHGDRLTINSVRGFVDLHM